MNLNWATYHRSAKTRSMLPSMLKLVRYAKTMPFTPSARALPLETSCFICSIVNISLIPSTINENKLKLVMEMHQMWRCVCGDHVTLSRRDVSPWWVKLFAVSQSKITKTNPAVREVMFWANSLHFVRLLGPSIREKYDLAFIRRET